MSGLLCRAMAKSAEGEGGLHGGLRGSQAPGFQGSSVGSSVCTRGVENQAGWSLLWVQSSLKTVLCYLTTGAAVAIFLLYLLPPPIARKQFFYWKSEMRETFISEPHWSICWHHASHLIYPVMSWKKRICLKIVKVSKQQAEDGWRPHQALMGEELMDRNKVSNGVQRWAIGTLFKNIHFQ